VVLDEGQHAVLAAVEGLEVVEQVAVGFEHVDVVLTGVAHGHVAQDEPVGAVGADAHVLDRADRPVVGGLDAAGVDDHVVGAGSRALDLEVAADARAPVGYAVAILQRWPGVLARTGARPITAIRFWSLGHLVW